VLFTDFVQDQYAVVQSIYDAFDLPMSEQGEAAMKAFIEDNPPGKHGVHRYAPEDYGLVPEQVRADFAEYIEHFGLPREERPGVDTMPG